MDSTVDEDDILGLDDYDPNELDDEYDESFLLGEDADTGDDDEPPLKSAKIERQSSRTKAASPRVARSLSNPDLNPKLSSAETSSRLDSPPSVSAGQQSDVLEGVKNGLDQSSCANDDTAISEQVLEEEETAVDSTTVDVPPLDNGHSASNEDVSAPPEDHQDESLDYDEDDDDDEEENHRDKFKSERNPQNNVQRLAGGGAKTIPDSLDSVVTRGGQPEKPSMGPEGGMPNKRFYQGGRGARGGRGGGRGAGGRGRGQWHKGQQQNHQQQGSKVLINPMYTGTVAADPNIRLSWQPQQVVQYGNMKVRIPRPVIPGASLSATNIAQPEVPGTMPANLVMHPPPNLLSHGGGGVLSSMLPTSVSLHPHSSGSVFPTGSAALMLGPPPSVSMAIARPTAPTGVMLVTSLAGLTPSTASIYTRLPPPPPLTSNRAPISHHHLMSPPRSMNNQPGLMGPAPGSNEWLKLTEDFLKRASSASSSPVQHQQQPVGNSKRQRAAHQVRKKYGLPTRGEAAAEDRRRSIRRSLSRDDYERDRRPHPSSRTADKEAAKVVGVNDDYMRKIEEQKRLRERLLQQKEMRRQQDMQQKRGQVAASSEASASSSQSSVASVPPKKTQSATKPTTKTTTAVESTTTRKNWHGAKKAENQQRGIGPKSESGVISLKREVRLPSNESGRVQVEERKLTIRRGEATGSMVVKKPILPPLEPQDSSPPLKRKTTTVSTGLTRTVAPSAVNKGAEETQKPRLSIHERLGKLAKDQGDSSKSTTISSNAPRRTISVWPAVAQTGTARSGKRVVALPPSASSSEESLGEERPRKRLVAAPTARTVAPPMRAVVPPQHAPPVSVCELVAESLREQVKASVASSRPLLAISSDRTGKGPRYSMAPMPSSSTESTSSGSSLEARGQVAAVVRRLSDSTGVERMRLIAGTVGKVKRCAQPEPGTMAIVFSKPDDAAAFCYRYNGKTLDGSQLVATVEPWMQ